MFVVRSGRLEFGDLTRAIPTGLHPTAQGCCTQLPWVSVRFDANLEGGCGIAARGAWGLGNPFRVRANLPRAPKVAEYGNLGLRFATTSWLGDKLKFVWRMSMSLNRSATFTWCPPRTT